MRTRNSAPSPMMSFGIIMTLVILFICPLLVKLVQIPLTANENFIYEKTAFNDLFSNFRGIGLVTLTVILTVWFVFEILTKGKKLEMSQFVLPVVAYAVLTTASALGSIDKTVALRGVVDRYEGLWIILSYCALFIISTQLNDIHKYARYLLITLASSFSIVIIAGITQPLNFNIMNIDMIKGLIIGYDNVGKISDVFKNPLMIYSTLGNPNMVGSYIALLLPIAFYCFLSLEKNAKIIPAVLWASGVCLMVGSRSLAGLAGFIIGHALLIRFIDNRRAIQSLILVTSAVGTTVIYDYFSPNSLLDIEYLGVLLSGIFFWIALYLVKRIQIKHTRLIIVSLLLLAVPLSIFYFNITKTQERNRPLYINDIKTDKNELSINFTLNNKTTALKIKSNDQNLTFYDSGQELKTTEHSEYYSIDGNQYSDFNYIYIHKEQYDFIMFKKLNFGFFVKNNKFFMMNSGKNSVNIQDPDKLPIDHFERLGSSRAYIWSRSIPLIKDTMLLGVGPDNFVFKFPQNDLVGKLNIGNPLLIIDKPHNWYIQIAINSGFIALMCILYLYFNTCKMYLNRIKDIVVLHMQDHLYIGLFSGITGYHIAALFNDSSVSVAPTFWILYGLMIVLMNNKAVR